MEVQVHEGKYLLPHTGLHSENTAAAEISVHSHFINKYSLTVRECKKIILNQLK